jgi:hypothetical protein
VAVGARVGNGDRVVGVPALLAPDLEDQFLPGVVGMQRGDVAIHGIVELHRAHACGQTELELMGAGEEGLILADRLSLVVVDGPA